MTQRKRPSLGSIECYWHVIRAQNVKTARDMICPYKYVDEAKKKGWAKL